MAESLSLEDFLEKHRIARSTWDEADIEWPTLQAIAEDHEKQSSNLENSAEFIAKVIQKFNGVHSVRWRVKNSEHLMAKIVRKKSEGNQKYADITKNNYFEKVADLIGVRALHLFKEDCFEIDAALKAQWDPIETPVAYIREGDSDSLTSGFTSQGFEVKNHPAGYRSIHYVVESMPLKRKIYSEIQVRTIFEEGWSEIDHKIRYPNFSDNPLVQYFLEIFNRMAGSADEMGGFVLGLVSTIGQLEDKIRVTNKEKDEVFKQMELALSTLENVKEQDKASKESVATLKMEIEKLKQENQAARGLTPHEAAAAKFSMNLTEMVKLAGKRNLEDILKPIDFTAAHPRLADLLKPIDLAPANRRLAEKSKPPEHLTLARPSRKNK